MNNRKKMKLIGREQLEKMLKLFLLTMYKIISTVTKMCSFSS